MAGAIASLGIVAGINPTALPAASLLDGWDCGVDTTTQLHLL